VVLLEEELALALEAVDTRHRLAFVVLAKKVHMTREQTLQGVKERENLDRIAPAVDIVTKEDIRPHRTVIEAAEDLKKVVDAPMQVTDNNVRALQRQYDRLLSKQRRRMIHK
jgi:alcohol dehydrogenase class IV